MTDTFIIIFEILITFCESYIKYLFIKFFLCKDRRAGYPIIVASIMETIVITLLNNLHLFSYYTLFISIVLTCIFSAVIFRINVISVFAISSTYYYMTEIIGFLYLSIVSILLNDNNYAHYILNEYSISRLVFIVIIKLIILAIYLNLHKFAYNLFQTSFSRLFMFFISILGIIGTFYLTMNSLRDMSHSVVLNWIFYFCIIILSFSSFLSFSKYRDEVEKQNVIELKSLCIEKSYDELHNNYCQQAKIYHDLNNNISVLNNLIKTKKYEKANSYIEEIVNPMKNLQQDIITGNGIIDFVINYKSAQAAKHNIKMNISADFPPTIRINEKDLSTILFNLLDNAIEACVNIEHLTKDKWITLRMCPVGNMYVIKIINPCSMKDMETSDVILETTKNNTALHGWGVKSVVSTVEKYGGTCQIKVKDNEFCFSVMIFDTK